MYTKDSVHSGTILHCSLHHVNIQDFNSFLGRISQRVKTLNGTIPDTVRLINFMYHYYNYLELGLALVFNTS